AVARHLLARPLVDLLVADAVGGPFLELVEMDALVGGRRGEPDRDVDQAEAERPLPDRACHGDKLPAGGRSTTLIQRFATLISCPRTLPAASDRPFWSGS